MKENLSGNQFKQLPMFMSAREIKSQYQPLPGDRKPTGYLQYETDDQLYARKAKESKHRGKGIRSGGPSLYESIASQGVKDPIHLSTDPPMKNRFTADKTQDFSSPYVAGGHHRVAVAGEVDPDRLQPVMHHKDISEAKGFAREPDAPNWQKAYGRKYS